jgi:16S rRNA (uracil1498-N3)-methyltransferase
MNRFFIAEEQRDGEQILFSEEVSHQIKRVLRLQKQDQVLCPNGLGQTYLVALVDLEGKQAVGNILQTLSESTEPKLKVTLVQGLPKGERWDFILQKGTELGIHQFQPVLTERTIVRLDPKEAAKKNTRWHKIVEEAAEQSHREICPEVAPVLQLNQWLMGKSKYDLLLLAWEEEKSCSLVTILQQNPEVETIAIIIGPEGGFSAEEAKRMQTAGAISVSLGPRILRTETAAMALSTMVMYHYGQMEV